MLPVHRAPPKAASELRMECTINAAQASSDLLLLRSRILPAVGMTARKQLSLIEQKLGAAGRSAPPLPRSGVASRTAPALVRPELTARQIQAAVHERFGPNFDRAVMAHGRPSSGLHVSSPPRNRPASARPMSAQGAALCRPASAPSTQKSPGQDAAARGPAHLAPPAGATLSASRSAPSFGPRPGARRMRPARRPGTPKRSSSLQLQRANGSSGPSVELLDLDTTWYADVVRQVKAAWASSVCCDPLGATQDSRRDRAIFQAVPRPQVVPGEAATLQARFGQA